MPRPDDERKFETPEIEEEVAELQTKVADHENRLDDLTQKVDLLMARAAKCAQHDEEIHEMQRHMRKLST